MMESRKSFYKLFGRYMDNLKKGHYSIIVDNSKLFNFLLDYSSSVYKTNKFIVISNSSKFGNNTFLSWVYIIGSILVFLSILIIIILNVSKDEKFDHHKLKWIKYL